MTAVLATELKKNFKVYAGRAATGEIIKIKRPKKTEDLILMSERNLEQYRRVIMYFAMMNGYKSVEELLYSDFEDKKSKSYYDDNFKALFGCIKEEELIIPEELPWNLDFAREELV